MTDAIVSSEIKRTPFYRRRWFIILLLVTVVASPLALLSVITGTVYRKSQSDGLWLPVKTSSRVIYILLALWSSALCVLYTTNPHRASQIWNDSAENYQQANDLANAPKGAAQP